MRLEGKNGKTTVQFLVKCQAIYFTLVAEQYQTAKQHNIHITELESIKNTEIICAIVEKLPLANL